MDGRQPNPRGSWRPDGGLLKPKQKMRMGCWNVQTLYQTGRMPQVVKEFDNYNLDILGVNEVRWTCTGKRRLASGHTIVFSGRSDDQHSEGVALLLNRKTEKALLEWKPFGSRLLKARFHSKYTKLSVLVCYAPTGRCKCRSQECILRSAPNSRGERPCCSFLAI